MKPTVGLASRYLVIPISEHQDSPGPMARTVKDVAYLLQAIAGTDPADNYTLANPWKEKLPDYIAACRDSVIQNMRIGVPRNLLTLLPLQISEAGRRQIHEFNDAVKLLSSAGADIVNADFKDPLNSLTMGSSWEQSVLGADFVVNLHQYLSNLETNPNNITSLADLREWTWTSSTEEYPRRNTGIWDRILDGQWWNNTDPQFWETYQKAIDYANTKGLIGTIKREKLDAVVLPAAYSSSWAATVGAPVITVPLGMHPSDSTVVTSRGLVETAPGIPYVQRFRGMKS
jgi:amidase